MLKRNFADIRALYARHWWLTPLTIFIIWRIALEIIGQIFFSISGVPISNWKEIPFPPLWARWDSGWYASILNYGYNLRGPGVMSNVTFFPLFPLIWKFFEIITPLKGFMAALVVNNILALLGFTVFFRWVEENWNKLVALKSLVALLIFPTSFFFISAYSESTLFLFIASTLLFSSRKQWLYAATTVALAGAARPTGILLWPLLAWLWWSSHSNKSKPWREFFAILLIPPIGLLLFSLHLYFRSGNPFAWLSKQADAGRGLVSPFALLWAYIRNILSRGDYWLKHLAEMAALIFVIILIPKLKKIHPAYVLYAMLNLLPSLLSNTLTSLQRFVLVLAPIFVVVALQKRWLYVFYSTAAIILLFYSVFRFVSFQWAG